MSRSIFPFGLAGMESSDPARPEGEFEGSGPSVIDEPRHQEPEDACPFRWVKDAPDRFERGDWLASEQERRSYSGPGIMTFGGTIMNQRKFAEAEGLEWPPRWDPNRRF